MATNIYNYNGTLATTIADGAIDNTTSIAMPGRGFLNYGEPVNQDMLWIMQNFANSSAPSSPTTGQLWYNTTANTLNMYTGSAWVSAGGAIISGTNPGSGTSQGSLWFDSTNKQLFVWSGTAWLLVGPLGSAINTDPVNPDLPTFSEISAVRLTDTSANLHQAWEIIIGGALLAIFSKDSTYSTTLSGFTTINPGLNFNSNIPSAGVTSTNNFTSLQTNLPSVDNTYNMGSASYRFSNMYAVQFNGQATSALYADLAERYHADAKYDPGTIVCLGGSAEITASNTLGTHDIFGVISTNPAHLMNAEAGTDDTHPAVALAGRVPCKVVGPVKKGERLMSSAIAGCACAWSAEAGLLAILGRSLVEKTSADIETIEIVVGKN
jgi:hypothetical protein